MLKGLLLPLRGYLSTPPRSICHHLSLAGIQSVTTESRLQPRNSTDGGSILTGTWRHRRSSSALVLPPANSGALNLFNPNVVPDNNADGDKAPIDAVGDKTPIDVKPTMDAKDKGPAEATVDPASINTILPSELACSASLVYIPKGMEIVETRTHYFPLKDKWHAINDPSRHYDCVPIPRLFPKPHPFVCVPWNVHDPELPPGLPVPFLRTLNLPVPVPTPAPSTSSSESSSNDSDSSSTYPLISNYINLNHQGVQKLLLDDNTPPTAVCIYTEEDVMRIFEGIAPEYVDMCSEYPPSSLAESDRRVMFFENMQWFFRNKRSTYLSTRKF
ncbi:hypothetical protein PGT21_023933 [Puccinia graminis f. sp. tritici]|uniref:Uncharacterized protein n=1 Tax=Puccinia graminis f. sp. tritici TaxID=56615 RepID=A0A5B0MXR7_PUCGR|nr:hypothetical protein PGT21_023933 [Puccinia graminis f. sp. tritici]